MSEAQYQGFQKEDLPYFETPDRLSRINIIAGTYKGITGPVNSLTGIQAMTLYTKTGAKASINISENRNVFVYQLGGKANINGKELEGRQLISFGNTGTEIEINSISPGRYLIVDGKPINEPVYQYGPFVMNSKSEILEAMQDYESGKMGNLDK